MTPSVKLKPYAKSSRSCGVHIITANGVELYMTLTGVSTGTSRAASLGSRPSNQNARAASASLGDIAASVRCTGRSIPGVNLAQSFIEARNQELLVKGGGHAMAGGFTVMPDRLPEFREFLSKSITAQMEHMDLTQETVIDGIASIRGAQSQFVRLITDHIGPFGPQNAEPVFALANVRIQMVDVLKDKHIRVQMSDWEGGPRMKAMFFYGIGTKLGETLLNHGQRLLHFAGQFQINNWQGRENVEFLISDAAVASENTQAA